MTESKLYCTKYSHATCASSFYWINKYINQRMVGKMGLSMSIKLTLMTCNNCVDDFLPDILTVTHVYSVIHQWNKLVGWLAKRGRLHKEYRILHVISTELLFKNGAACSCKKQRMWALCIVIPETWPWDLVVTSTKDIGTEIIICLFVCTC